MDDVPLGDTKQTEGKRVWRSTWKPNATTSEGMQQNSSHQSRKQCTNGKYHRKVSFLTWKRKNICNHKLPLHLPLWPCTKCEPCVNFLACFLYLPRLQTCYSIDELTGAIRGDSSDCVPDYYTLLVHRGTDQLWQGEGGSSSGLLWETLSFEMFLSTLHEIVNICWSPSGFQWRKWMLKWVRWLWTAVKVAMALPANSESGCSHSVQTSPAVVSHKLTSTDLYQ